MMTVLDEIIFKARSVGINIVTISVDPVTFANLKKEGVRVNPSYLGLDHFTYLGVKIYIHPAIDH